MTPFKPAVTSVYSKATSMWPGRPGAGPDLPASPGHPRFRDTESSVASSLARGNKGTERLRNLPLATQQVRHHTVVLKRRVLP